jgi:hypothetical protein
VSLSQLESCWQRVAPRNSPKRRPTDEQRCQARDSDDRHWYVYRRAKSALRSAGGFLRKAIANSI